MPNTSSNIFTNIINRYIQYVNETSSKKKKVHTVFRATKLQTYSRPSPQTSSKEYSLDVLTVGVSFKNFSIPVFIFHEIKNYGINDFFSSFSNYMYRVRPKQKLRCTISSNVMAKYLRREQSITPPAARNNIQFGNVQKKVYNRTSVMILSRNKAKYTVQIILAWSIVSR